MAGRTISSNYNAEITLSDTADNPVSVTGNITPASGTALYGQGGASNSWTVATSGVIATGKGTGIQLGTAATFVGTSIVTNMTGGTISGSNGILVYNNASSPGTITNQANATVAASSYGVFFFGQGTITNSGVIIGAGNYGVILNGGGALVNDAGGTISGSVGVQVTGSTTVTNAGTIAGTGGVALNFGSGVDKRLIVDPGAVFVGSVQGGNGTLELASAAGTGTLTATNFTNFNAITFDKSSTWDLVGNASALSGTITGFTANDTIDLTGFAATSETFASNALVLTNAATQHATLHIQGSFTSGDFSIGSDGSLGTDITLKGASAGRTIASTYTSVQTLTDTADNPVLLTSTATITDKSGIAALYGQGEKAQTWTITNKGVIAEYDNSPGVLLGSGTIASVTNASITNYGTITGGEGIRIFNTNASSVVNQAGGTITGNNASGIDLHGSGTVTNSGIIIAASSSAASFGAYLRSGGIVINNANAEITGAIGVVLGGAGTVTNAGTISSLPGYGSAIQFDSKGDDQLIVDPGAVFYGLVNGGGGIVHLASGSSQGTLTGFDGATFANFGSLQFDDGALWTVTGDSSDFGLAGIKIITGFTASDTIDLTGFVVNSDVYNNYGLVLTNASDIHATLHLQGKFTTADFQITRAGGGSIITFGTGGTSGTISGTHDTGVTLSTPTASVTGTISVATGVALYGAGGTNYTWTIDNAGSINSGDTYAIALGSTTSHVASGILTNENYGVISGGSAGVYIYGPGSVTNVAGGTIIGSGNDGVRFDGGLGTLFNAGVVLGANYGVEAKVGGSVFNLSGGTIDGTAGAGVRIDAYLGTVINQGVLTGGQDGVNEQYGGSVTNLAGGIITGTANAGILIDVGYGTVVNYGIVLGGKYGVVERQGGSVTNLAGGSITATTNDAIHIDGYPGTVVNQGVVLGGKYGVVERQGGSVTNLAGGTITANANDAIHVDGAPAVVVNQGSLLGNSYGVYDTHGGSVTNLTGGIITGTNGDGVRIDGGVATVINYGVVSGANYGVNELLGGSVTNLSGGTITGAAGGGIRIDGSVATVVNDGVVLGTNYGVYERLGGSVTNLSGGNISGSNGDGVRIAGGTATVVNDAVISGANYGVNELLGGSVTNLSAGTISGDTGDGIRIAGGASTIVNAGIVLGANNGVNALLGGSVTNLADASITGSSKAGVRIDGDQGTIVNDGVVLGGLDGVLEVQGGSLTNHKTGTISGATGVLLQALGTVTNAGTINAADASSFAVTFAASGANRLIVDPGAVFYGRIDSGNGIVELESASSAGTLSGFGPSITNVASLEFDAGATWTISGDTAASGLGTIDILGFDAGDTIDLTGFVAIGKTFTGDGLVLTDALDNTTTLHIQGTHTTGEFQVTNDGTNSFIATSILPRSFNWIGGSADWETASNWNLATVPTTIDDASITVATTAYVVTVGDGHVDAINNVTLSAAKATLEVDGTLAATGTVAVTAGTLLVKGSLSAASITDTALLAYSGKQLLDNTPLTLGGTLQALSSGVATTLTLGLSEIITQSGATAILNSTTVAGNTIINQGTINAAVPGGSLSITPFDFTNTGLISVKNEALTIGYDDAHVGGARGPWSNSGTIALSGTSSLTFDGLVTTAGIGTITGATFITEAGVLDNTGAILNVGSGTQLGTVNLANAAVVTGGTIVDHGNAFTFNRNGTFDDVTYRGPLNIATAQGLLNVTNGLTVTSLDGKSPGVINLTEGNDAQLNFIGSQTIDNATINLNGTDSFNPLTEIDIGGGNGPQLTLGKNLIVSSTVDKAVADIRNTTNQDFTSVVNLGTIVAAAKNGSFQIAPNGGFTNNGTISVDNGENFEIEPGFDLFTNAASAAISVSNGSRLEFFYSGVASQVNNLGTITMGSGTTLDLASGPFTLGSLGTIVNQGATTLFDGTFDGEGGTIALGSGTEFNKVLLSGNLRNATLIANNSFTIVPGNASLQNVSFEGPLNVTSDFTNLTINQGVKLTGASGTQPGTITVTGQSDTLQFSNQYPAASTDGQTIANVILNVGNALGTDVISAAFAGGTFTIAADTTIVSSASGALAGLKLLSGDVILDGTLDAIANGGKFSITPAAGGVNFHNNGTMLAAGGDTLLLNTPIVTDLNTGTIDIATKGTFDVGGSFGVIASVVANQTIDFVDATGVLRLRQPTSFAAAIDGFAAGDTIDLPGLVVSKAAWTAGPLGQPGTLALSNAGTTLVTLSLFGNHSSTDFIVTSNGTNDSIVTATCYAAGTRILTPRGEIAIEHLHESDLVLTLSGRAQPIRWIGHRRVNFHHHPNRRRVLPIRIAAQAFGQGRPSRDLLLSPDHAVFVEHVLIPIRHLVNGSTVAQLERNAITYYHIELPQHDVLFADGMPAESYLEAGARDAFSNGGGVMQLYPDFGPPRDHYAMLWEISGYAPLVVAGEQLTRVRRRLARQTARLDPAARDRPRLQKPTANIAA